MWQCVGTRGWIEANAPKSKNSSVESTAPLRQLQRFIKLFENDDARLIYTQWSIPASLAGAGTPNSVRECRLNANTYSESERQRRKERIKGASTFSKNCRLFCNLGIIVSHTHCMSNFYKKRYDCYCYLKKRYCTFSFITKFFIKDPNKKSYYIFHSM